MSSQPIYVPKRGPGQQRNRDWRKVWREELKIWWREIDKVLLLLVGILM